MSSLAAAWVSPFWMVRVSQTFGIQQAQVFVTNPDDRPLRATFEWFKRDGSLVKESSPIQARSIGSFIPARINESMFGWLRITSDVPSAPWGVTPFGGRGEDWGQMTFYRIDISVIAGVVGVG